MVVAARNVALGCFLLRATLVEAAVITTATSAGWIYANKGETTANASAQKATWGVTIYKIDGVTINGDTTGNAVCITGKEQSPIDIVTKDIVKTTFPGITAHIDTTLTYVKNTGHGFQLFEEKPSEYVYDATRPSKMRAVDNSRTAKGYSMIAGSKYNFYQVNWHTPSENTINGVAAAMEAYFVHQLDVVALQTTRHRYAIISLQYDLGTILQCNPVLSKFWELFPEAVGIKEYKGANINMNTYLSDELAAGYYNWYGSLTVPPCTEGVSWNLLTTREKVCKAQVDMLKTALGATQGGIGFNNRVTQPLNHRAIALMEAGAPRAKPLNVAILTADASTYNYAATQTAAGVALTTVATVSNAKHQKDTWGGLCATGHEQSPINVVTIATIKGELPTIVTKLDKKANVDSNGAVTGKGTQVNFVTNSGHGFQLFEHSPRLHTLSGITVTPVASSGKGYSTISGRKFNFYSVNWHAPSENTVDGKSFALEANFVHQLDDASLVVASKYHRLAIIGLLYDLGTVCDTTLALFWDQFPAGVANGNIVRTAFAGTQPDFDKMLKTELDKGYYHWMGSMTTPPCTEGVSWNLIKTPKHVCQAQVNKLQASLAASQKGLNFNNRVVQPLNQRIVTEMLPLIKFDVQQNLTQAQWKLGIETGAGLGAIIQKMTKDFLFVAKGMNVVAMTADMNKNVKLLDDNLKALMYGGKIGTSGTVAATPTQRVLIQWYDVQFKWVSLRRLLEDNVATVRNAITGATNYAILERVYFENLPTLLSSDEATAMYMDAARVNNMIVPSLRVQIAGRQRMLSQKMSKEAIFVGLEVRVLESVGKLTSTMSLFEDSHYDIVRGVGSIDEMPMLTDMCTLYEMKSVNGKWNVMQPEISKIIDQNAATDIGLNTIRTSNLEVYDEMEKALYMYTHSNNVCDPIHSMNAASWDTIFAQLGRQRMLTQQAIGLFFQIVKGVDVGEAKQSLDTARSQGAEALRLAIEGSAYLNIPSPPVQAIADQLIHAEVYWGKFEAHIASDLLAADLKLVDLTRLAYYGDKCNTDMNKVADLYVNASMNHNPAARTIIIEVSWRQVRLIQLLIKHALLVSLGKEVVVNEAAFDMTILLFEKQHGELLHGRTAGAHRRLAGNTDKYAGIKTLYPSNLFLATKDACTLTIMGKTMLHFMTTASQLKEVIHGFEEEADEIAKINQALLSRARADAAMITGIGYYVSGTGVCNTVLSSKEWESGLQMAGKAALLVEEAQKDFVLLASGLAAQWMTEAAVALTEQTAFITDDVESPILVEALTDFADAFFQMGQSDVDRGYLLQTDYVVNNPNPDGSKDNMEFAPGPQSYHAVHKKYHNSFRETLALKKYEDIFLLDARGNLVYSLMKNRDFGSNFDATKAGEFRTSGLGKAFVSAMANPDVLTQTTWEAYPPQHNAMASFLARGIKSETGALVGTYVIQMPSVSMPIDSQDRLDKMIAAFKALMENLEFGVAGTDTAPPPKQTIADKVFALYDQWILFEAMLVGEKTVQTVKAILVKIKDINKATDDLMEVTVVEIWAADKSVPGQKIKLANKQMARLQAIAKEIALTYMATITPELEASMKTPEEFAVTMKDFNDAHTLLLAGNVVTVARRLVDEIIPLITDIPPSNDPIALKMMEDMKSDWDAFSAILHPITTENEETGDVAPVTAQIMRTIVEQADSTTAAMEQAVSFYASKYDITVLQPVYVLSPVPLTGGWNAGHTMRTAAKVAEGIINDEQFILPGFSMVHAFFDDKCDATECSQIVLREQASTTKYVALAGAGCDNVCADTAFIASSLRLPFLSYECAGAALSETSSYPEFTRFGTVVAPGAPAIIKQIGTEFAEWSHVEILSADPAVYRLVAETLVTGLNEKGLSAEYAYAYETEWSNIVDMVDEMRMNKRRVIFVMGSESYFRRIVCASIVVEANKGISWLSQGQWRDNWYKSADATLDSFLMLVEMDAKEAQVFLAMDDFQKGWNGMGADGTERATALAAYRTDQKEQLQYVVDPDGAIYHEHHKKWHPIYVAKLTSRNYYDIYLLDTMGNCIYSVYKEADFATNFGSVKNLPEDFRKYQNSGLGDAFRAAMSEQDVVAVTPWSPYGVTVGTVASFMAMAVKITAGAQPIGVFAAQMPAEAKSIEDIEPQCTMTAITESFEGAINIVGLGQPIAAELTKQVACFQGRTAQAFLEMLDHALANGYPLGDTTTQVAQPFQDLKAHAADATCVIAYALKHLMNEEKYSMADIEAKPVDVYSKFTAYIKTIADFEGASGLVNFKGNDKHAYLAVQQVKEGSKVTVGTCSHNISVDLTVNGGPSNASWKPAFPDVEPPAEDFPYWAFQIILPILCICCPALGACIKNF